MATVNLKNYKYSYHRQYGQQFQEIMQELSSQQQNPRQYSSSLLSTPTNRSIMYPPT